MTLALILILTLVTLIILVTLMQQAPRSHPASSLLIRMLPLNCNLPKASLAPTQIILTLPGHWKPLDVFRKNFTNWSQSTFLSPSIKIHIIISLGIANMLFCFVLNLYSFIHSNTFNLKSPIQVCSLLSKLSDRILSNFLTSKGHPIAATVPTPCFHLRAICIHG